MATIVMSAEKVIAAAQLTIELIKQKRLQEDEKMIEWYLKHRARSRFMLWLGFKNPTQEIAIQKMSQDVLGFFPSQRGWGDLEKARQLLKLAQHGDPVTLNEEDVRVLF